MIVHIIPVIDLLHGQVVQAIRGQRQHYRPIQSQLTSSHALYDVVAAILQAYACDCVYIADLNALLQDPTQPDHRHEIATTMRAFPELQWWVDAGIRTTVQLEAWRALGVRPILASESLSDLQRYQDLRAKDAQTLLSLDFFQEGFRGPEALLEQPATWTTPTIIMSLPHVGSLQGPDFERLRQLRAQAPAQCFYAAGGVRHQADIDALAAAGAQGVLVASALHQQTLRLPKR